MRRSGTVWLVLVSTSLSAVGGLGFLEWVVRYREAHRTTVPGTMPFLFYRQFRLEYALVRGSDYYGWVHINREGFRGREVSLTPPADVIRIMAVGASTTMDALVGRDESAWPARLEFWLNRQAPGQHFEVINAGVPGYHVIDNLIRFETELYRYRPNLVILYGSEHNDLLGALVAPGDTQPLNGDPRPGELPTITPWGRWLERHSLLYNKLLGRWLAIRSQHRGTGRRQATSPEQFERAISRGATGFGHDLGTFLFLARAEGIPVLLPQVVYMGSGSTRSRDSTQIAAVWRVAVPFAPPGTLFEGYTRFDSVTRSVAEAHGATYLPTTDSGLGATDLYAEGDPVHFNARGADRMGRMLADALLGAPPWQPAGGREHGRSRSGQQLP